MSVDFKSMMDEGESIVLTEDQQIAFDEIMHSLENPENVGGGGSHVLKGYAGTGKSTLMKKVLPELIRRKRRVMVTAPTNKATAVIGRMLDESGISVDTRTIYSALGLTPGSDDAKRAPKRVGINRTKKFDTIICDECSMNGSDLMEWVERDLRNHFVLFIGDPAQLPPVNEVISKTFLTKRQSQLTRIMRQAEGNPIIMLSKAIRDMQESGGAVDWGVFAAAEGDDGTGIYLPRDNVNDWMRDAFMSDEFQADNDTHRYLCWTNARVGQINRMVRSWIYGETETPFIAGERVLARSSILDDFEEVVINTNDEATVLDIRPARYSHIFGEYKGGRTAAGKEQYDIPAWTAELDVWAVMLESRAGKVVETNIAKDDRELKAINDELVGEARANSRRWHEYFDFQDKIARLQSVYAMTVHCSQGSTFGNAFVDIEDCSRNPRTAEMLQLLYVATTRPQKALMLAGI